MGEHTKIEETTEDKKVNAKITNLRRLRREADLTLKEVSNLSGVKFKTLQGYESNAPTKRVNRMPAEFMYKLSKALGCSMEDLLEMDEIDFDGEVF